ncbi:MAG TPA: hypothetical protein VJ804_00325 [Acidimicrobiales bacterium]|nr:hypothetical protein [Acidimicrobiales bacterium]
MRRGRRIRAAGLAVALVLTGAACGDDDVATGARPTELTLAYDPLTGVEPAALTTAIVDRLGSIGILVEGVDVDGEAGTVTVGLEDDRLAALSGELLAQQGVIRIRPVLAVITPDEAPAVAVTPADEDTAPAQPVVLVHRDREGAVDQTYQLGPAIVDVDAIATASAEEDAAGTLGIRLVLEEAALPGFEDAATICFGKATTCPLGLLAVTIDGEVLAAPEVAQPSFDDGAIFITPQLDDAGIHRLANVLAQGPLPVALVPAAIRSAGG